MLGKAGRQKEREREREKKKKTQSMSRKWCALGRPLDGFQPGEDRQNWQLDERTAMRAGSLKLRR